MLLPAHNNLSQAERAAITAFTTRLRDESRDAHTKAIAMADECSDIYHYGSSDPDATDEIDVNPIQNAVLAARDVQVREGFQVTIEPIESGEPGEWHWNGPQDVGIMLGLDPTQVATWDDGTGQLQPPQPIDPDFAESLQSQAVPKGAAQPGQIREDWLVNVDDRLVADELQAFFDVHWQRADTTFSVEDNLLDAGVHGWSFTLYEFDDLNHRHMHRDLPLPHVFIDPVCRDISQAAYAGFFEPIDEDEAKRLYPHLAELIEREAVEGTPTHQDGQQQISGSFNYNFRRRRIPLSVMWLRNQPIAMTPEEALETQSIEQRDVPDELAGLDVEGLDDGGIESADIPAGSGDGGEAAEDSGFGAEDRGSVAPTDDDRPHEDDVLDDQQPDSVGVGSVPAGEPVEVGAGEVAPITPTRRAFFLPGTDEEVTPTIPSDDGAEISHPKWPTRIGVREITELGTELVAYRESEYGADGIPILHNVNIPMTGRRCTGIGEPWRLKGAQRGYRKSLKNMLDHSDMYAHPPSIESQSMNDSLPEEYKEGFARPGQRYVVPDDLMLASRGKVSVFQEPPPLNQADTFLGPYLSSVVDRESGNNDVMQGRTNPAIKSGVAIGMLQSAATSLINSKARRTSRMIKRLSELQLHSLLWRETVDDFARVCSKYKPHILAAIWDRRRYIEWDLKVAVDGGGGGAQVQRRQLAQMDLEAGAIGMQTYRERANINHRTEKARQREELLEQAKNQMLLQPMLPVDPSQQQGQKPPSQPAK